MHNYLWIYVVKCDSILFLLRTLVIICLKWHSTHSGWSELDRNLHVCIIAYNLWTLQSNWRWITNDLLARNMQIWAIVIDWVVLVDCIARNVKLWAVKLKWNSVSIRNLCKKSKLPDLRQEFTIISRVILMSHNAIIELILYSSTDKRLLLIVRVTGNAE